MWYLDSGCSRHMKGYSTFFIELNEYDGGFVTFGDDGKGKIIAVGKVEDIIGNDDIVQQNSKDTNAAKSAENPQFDKTGDKIEWSPEPETRDKIESSSDSTETATNAETNPFEEDLQMPKPREWRFMDNYPQEFIIGETSQGIMKRSRSRRLNSNNLAFISTIEPESIDKALVDPS
ncbi:hypothetical protein PIB30_061956 [Stylosanthes scabra]|uniref:Retrovirus-related Pol polyprotein from transposon TNT 1-94-like beta-barrel domain-containing protein n=1 Tax=Stylosanthes scabra TaxID=79078 RepID=A0ABU6YJN2_9FABA|nr:hypothetical protein [Stylosanthes scabra]